MSDQSSTRIVGLHTVGITVSDQDRALEFYVDKLGFETRLDAPFGESRWIEVAPPGAVTTIALVAAGSGAPAGGADTGIRLATEDADTDHAALLERGVDVDPEVMRMGDYVPPMFSLRDPDGNALVVVGSF